MLVCVCFLLAIELEYLLFHEWIEWVILWSSPFEEAVRRIFSKRMNFCCGAMHIDMNISQKDHWWFAWIEIDAAHTMCKYWARIAKQSIVNTSCNDDDDFVLLFRSADAHAQFFFNLWLLCHIVVVVVAVADDDIDDAIHIIIEWTYDWPHTCCIVLKRERRRKQGDNR